MYDNLRYLLIFNYKPLMNKIKFGISVNQVGAITVWNYRIRTKKESALEKALRTISVLGVLVHITDSTQNCVKFDFSTTNKKYFDKVVLEIAAQRAEAEIIAVKEKWQHLFEVRYSKRSRKSIPAFELEPLL